jgi:glycerophosphoryl diester phosphodiesterase
LNIAHRGARAFAPENTLPAFIKARALGCPMFELDVHMSKDGEIVVHHDDRLERCTDVVAKFPGRSSYFVSDFTSRELRTLDAGTWFADEVSRPSGKRQSFLQGLTDEAALRDLATISGCSTLTQSSRSKASVSSLPEQW